MGKYPSFLNLNFKRQECKKLYDEKNTFHAILHAGR